VCVKCSLEHFGKIRIGVAEKGYATLELSVKMTAGHSSVPPRETALGVLAGAVSRLERNPQVNFCFHFLELEVEWWKRLYVNSLDLIRHFGGIR